MCSCRGTAGFAHVSCLAEQAKILVAEAEEGNLGVKVLNERLDRWSTCSLCEQRYHGVVLCALGWACWKTYVGRPEADVLRKFAMNQLGNGLTAADHHEAALSTREAELSMRQRLGDSAQSILITQNNIAVTYSNLGRLEPALRLKRDVYYGRLKLFGEEHERTLFAANNYASSLCSLGRFEDAKSLLRKIMPVARRELGEENETMLRMRELYAMTLCLENGGTLDNIREAVATMEDVERIARRVLGGAHPLAVDFVLDLQNARAVLAARDVEPLREAVGAMGV